MMAKNRIKIGTWLKEMSPLIKRSALGVAYVSQNILTNLILKGIFLVKSPEWPNKICNSIADAEKWANEIIKV
jgi:tRNA (Thr-GGU) A37 N-methylase